MHLPRHTLSSQIVAPAFVTATFTPSYPPSAPDPSSSLPSCTPSSSASSSATSSISHGYTIGSDAAPPKSHLFACATRSGFLVAQTYPLKVVATKTFEPSQGGLSIAATIDDTSLLVLVGGGRVPRFAPNKVVLWDESVSFRSSQQGEDDYASTAHPRKAAEEDTSLAASTVFDAGSTFGGGERLESPQRSYDAPDISNNMKSSSVGSLSSLRDGQKVVGEGSDTVNADKLLDLPSSGLVGLGSSLIQSQSLPSGADQGASTSLELPLSSSGDDFLSATTEGLEDPFAKSEHEVESCNCPLEGERSIPESFPPLAIDVPHERSAREVEDESSDKSRITGREILELEFGEAVQSVIARSFQLPLTATVSAHSGSHGHRDSQLFKMALLVVILKTKAVVFELGEHLSMNPVRDQQRHRTASPLPWGIVHRTTVDILDDGRGLVDLVGLPGRRSALLTLAGRQPGHVQLIILSLLGSKRTTGAATSSSGVLASSIIAAHSASLVSLTLSHCGSLLATASTKGTLVRVWSTTGKAVAAGKTRTTIKASLQRELRRGTEQAIILSMAFAPDRSALAAASDKGTIHFFNLRDESVVGSKTGASGRLGSGEASIGQASSQPGSAFSLSNSAAKYLPSGINQLALQIPSSLLPSYLKSTWSTAQFRIKLRTFAAYSSEERATRKSSSARKGRSGGVGGNRVGDDKRPSYEDVPAGRAGAARSTEGAWATLKGRLEDIRRWEPALDERIFLSWVWVPDDIAPSQASPSASNSAPGSMGKSRSTRSLEKGKGPGVRQQREPHDRRLRPSDPTSSPTTGGYQLVALTTSGGWYRVSLQEQQRRRKEEVTTAVGSSASTSDYRHSHDDDDEAGSGETVLNMYKQGSGPSRDKTRGSSGSTRTPLGSSSGSGSSHRSSASAGPQRSGAGIPAGVSAGEEGKEGTILEEYRSFDTREEHWDALGGWTA